MKIGLRRVLAALLVTTTLSGLGALAACAPGAPPARPGAVVFLIGDGMGISQVTFSRVLVHGKAGRFAFESLPVTALMSTWSASNAVTDSGAAATAMASAVKTGNQFIGMDPSEKPVESITETAKKKGWKVGYVTTTTLAHATPASFYAHLGNRYDYRAIAAQLLPHEPDVALAGGLADFLPKGVEGGEREDGRNLVAEAEAKGYTVLRRGSALPIDAPPERLLGLFAWSHLGFQLDERELPPERRDPALADLTRLALASLDRGEAPFFLMVEGGRIDHAAHGFDAAGTAAETAAFDEAVKVVLDYQSKHPETLVLLTADHATGGLAINDYVDWELLRKQKASLEILSGLIKDGGIPVEEVARLTGLTDLTEEELTPIRTEKNGYEAGRKLGQLLAKRTGVTWIPRINDADTKGHTGEDVALYAGGPGAERFAGLLDNTDIPKRIKALLGW